jgi:hypothetical protein
MSGLFNEASLVLVPSGYKAGKVYSEVPTDGDGDLTFTRASSATRVNSDGLIESPRTNLVLYSEEFDNAYWNKALGTITANATTAPDGTLTADLFTKTSGVNTVSQLGSSTSVYTTTGANTLSVYIKPNVGNSVILRLDNGGNTANFAFNFTTKTFSSSGANVISSSFDELLNGWFRLKVTGNVTSTSWSLTHCLLFDNPTNDSMYIWGAQLEQGSTATEYIPTTNSARTTFAGITQDGTSAANVPRLDYSQGSCPALLLEPQRTNSVLYSNNTFANGTNGSSATTTTPSVIDGVNYRKMTATAVDGNIFASVSQLGSTPTGLMCFSVFLKKGSCDDVQIIDQNTTGKSIRVNLSNGAIISQSLGLICGVESYGNDVYRVYIVQDFTSIGFRYDLYAKEIGDFYYTTAQMESGSYPTSVIITNGAASTRLADDVSLTSAAVSTIAPTSGVTMFIDFYLSQNQQTARFAVFDNAYSNYIFLGSQDLASNQSLRCDVRGGGVTFLSYAPSFTSVGRHKMAVKFLTSGIKVYLDGVEVASSGANAGFSASFQKIILGRDYPLAAGAFSTSMTNSIMIFPTALTDTQCIELTTL